MEAPFAAACLRRKKATNAAAAVLKGSEGQIKGYGRVGGTFCGHFTLPVTKTNFGNFCHWFILTLSSVSSKASFPYIATAVAAEYDRRQVQLY